MPIQGEYKEIKYFSCLELAFILRVEQKGLQIKNFDLDPIPYTANGRSHLYYPDFIVDEKIIVEIKGLILPKNREKIEQKKLALKRFCQGGEYSCQFITKEQIGKNLIRRARKIHERLQHV